MVDSSTTRRDDGETTGWLSLREASKQMGVSAATLRAWADDGRVQTYRTPGGHRRFRLGAAEPLVNEPRQPAAIRWRLLEHSALGRMRLALEESAQETNALATLPPPARAEHRKLGRELVRLLIAGLQKGGQAIESRGEVLGKQYARLHWRYGFKQRDALTTLSFFRNSFIASVLEFAFGLGQPEPDQLASWVTSVNGIIDHVSISMLEYSPEQPTKNVAK
ncbi:MAG: excisionase family DNA-binding protein [Chloroflexi bacterium]|nr:excisionase family DNA-binding protein [Chloroflexota bacterium]